MFQEVVRSASGKSGEVRCGYQLAARLANWTLTPGSARQVFNVTGTGQIVSEHWMEQEPLALVLDLGYVRWTWEAVQPQIAAGRMSVQVHGRPHAEYLR